MKLQLYIDKRADKRGTFPVRLSVSFLGQRFITSLGTNMTHDEFASLKADFTGQETTSKTKHPHHKELIRKLDAISDALEWEQRKVEKGELRTCDVDFSSIINKYKGNGTKSSKNVFNPLDMWLDFITEERKNKDLADGTVSALTSFFKRFQNYAKGKTFAEIGTADFVTGWMQYNVGRGVSNNTTKNQVTYLMWFLLWCYRKGYCGDDFKRFHFELRTGDKKENIVIFLNLDEIRQISDLKLEGNIALSRDILLFQCYTGLRVSDVYRLKKDDIKDGVLHLSLKKTNAFVDNRLNKHALAVAKKYANTDTDRLFPFLNLNSLELYLKEIAKLAGIDEPVRRIDYRNHERQEYTVSKWQLMTSHVGRRSFIVNSLDMDLTPTQVISYTGHSSIQAMEPYISISDKKKDSAMDVWNNQSAESEADSIKRQIEELTKRLKHIEQSP